MLAALLHNKHRQPDSHHPRKQHHPVLFPGHPHLRQLLRQPLPLRLPLQLQAELREGALLSQIQQQQQRRPLQGPESRGAEPTRGHEESHFNGTMWGTAERTSAEQRGTSFKAHIVCRDKPRSWSDSVLSACLGSILALEECPFS